MRAILAPFSVLCGSCGEALLYDRPPSPPDFVVSVSCPKCGWVGSLSLPQAPVRIIQTMPWSTVT